MGMPRRVTASRDCCFADAFECREYRKKRESSAPRPAPPVSSCSFSLWSARDSVNQ
jgi:hypothetical protein